MPRVASSWLTLLALLASGCCAHRFTRPDGAAPQGPDVALALRARGDRIQSIEMLTRIQFFGDGGRLKGKVEILGRRPGSLRFEALTPSDDTLALLATDGARFMSHERGSTECLVGPACPTNVARLIPIALPPAALLDALTGNVFDVEGTPTVSWDECEGTWLFERFNGEVRQRAWLKPVELAAVRVELDRAGVTFLRIDYDGEEEVDGIAMPTSIRVEAPGREQELELTVSERYINGIEDEAPFAPECPAGTRTVELPCQDLPVTSPKAAPNP